MSVLLLSITDKKGFFAAKESDAFSVFCGLLKRNAGQSNSHIFI